MTSSPYPALILARIAENGVMSAIDLANALRCSASTVNGHVAQLKADGKIEQVFLGRGSFNNRLYGYRLPEKPEFPQIRGTRYLGWRPTGTRPGDVLTLKLDKFAE